MSVTFTALERKRLVEIFDANPKAPLHEVRDLFRQRMGRVIGDTTAREVLIQSGRDVNRRSRRKGDGGS